MQVLYPVSLKELEEFQRNWFRQELENYFNDNPPKQEQSEDIDRYLSKKEAAKLWGCCTSTIDNYARRGVLTRHYVGSAVRFKRSEVLEVIQTMNK